MNKNLTNISECYIWGAGEQAQCFIKLTDGNFKILNIYDNDEEKDNTFFEGIKVVHSSKLEQRNLKIKILISTNYHTIKDQLIELGLKENEDFFEISQFVCQWYWHNKKQIIIPETHVALTTKCTLNCKHCNMFIPYQKNNGSHQPLDKIIESIDYFFKFVDKVYNFTLLGGEPFLYPYLVEVINHLYDNYKDKIHNIQLITNGTIVPKLKIIESLKNKNVMILISDYTSTLDYAPKLKELEKLLTENHLAHKTKSSLQWLDFRFPHENFSIPDNKVYKHTFECRPIFKGLNDNKFYYCHIVWSAQQSNLIEDNKNDYIDLETLQPENNADKLKLLHHSLGLEYSENKFLSLCKKCAGCARSNTKKVDAAIQKEKHVNREKR